MTLWSYTVTYLPSTDITAYVTEISDVTIPTNEVRSAEFTLRAKDGAFRTIDNSGATPKLTKYDKIKIQFTDRDNNSETHIFEVDTLRPIKDTSGNKLVVGCLGQENHLHHIHYPKSKKRISAFDMIKDIVDVYNDNNGSAQVEIEKHDDDTFNKAPIWTVNDYDFSDNPTCFEALMRVMDRMGSSVANGGAGDFYEMVFVEGSDSAKINIKVFVSGESGSEVVSNSLTTPVRLTHGTEENETGTIVIGLGAQGFGSLPKDFRKFVGKLESFQLHPQHQTGKTYPSGVSVQLNGVHYKSNTSTANAPGHSDWDIIKEADTIGLIPASPWTYLKAGLWKNSGSASGSSASSGFGQKGCWDGNLVIRDEDHYRNWVHVKSNTSEFNTAYKYGNAAGGSYRGLRVLVTGTLAGDFALNSGNDKNGVAYANALVKHNGGTNTGSDAYKNWDVIRSASNNDVCAVIDEGKNYLYSSSSWSDDSANARANDCFHVYETLTNTTGTSTTSKQKGDNSWLDLDGDGSADTSETYGTNSAITVKYEYDITDIGTNLYTSVDSYKIGAWLNLMFPFPANTNNGIATGSNPTNLGAHYGGTSSTKEPATFDASGTFALTPTGQSGYSKSDAEELGAIDSINFMFKHRFDLSDQVAIFDIGGKFKWRCTVYDDSDNVVYQDFEVLDNDRWEFQSLPISGFKPYRARAARKWSNILSNMIVPELEVLEKFEWKNVRMISFQNQESYDEHGRYHPNGSRFYLNVNNIVAAGTQNVRQLVSIDNFHFGKQLIAVTSPEGTRNIEAGIVQRPNTTNFEQLKQDMEAQKEIEKHQYRAFEVEQEGRNDIAPGESFFLNDDKMIDDSDSATNQIKLVNKEVHYSVNGSDGGSGGYVRRILGVKRI